MREHIKKHDLRDDIFTPPSTATPLHRDPLEDKGAAEAVKSDGAPLATPDKGVVDGQTTHM